MGWGSTLLTFKCLLDVDGFFRTRLEIGNATLGLAVSHGALL